MATPAPPAPVLTPTPVPPTPGWKTSEAWISLLLVIIGSLPSTGLLNNAPDLVKIVGLISAVLTALNYTMQRTSLKKAALRVQQLLLIVVLSMLVTTQSACGADCKDPKNASSAQCVINGAVVDCTGVSSIPTAVSVVGPIVDKLIAGATQADGSINWASIEPQLVTLALQYGTCVLAEIWNHYIHGTPIGGGSVVAHTAKASPADLAGEFDRIRAIVAPGKTFKVEGGATL